jgi:Na+/glutamate symporter
MYVGAMAGAGAIVASGGTLAAAIAAAALAGGTGGFIGSILARWVGDRHAHNLQEQMDHGGLLLWVRTRHAEDEKRAMEILKKHSGHDVHIHALPTAVDTHTRV